MLYSEKSSSHSNKKHEGDNQNSQGDCNTEGNRDLRVNNPNQEDETHYTEGNENDSNVEEKNCSTASNNLILEDKNQTTPAEGNNNNPEYNEYHDNSPGFPCQSCLPKEQESTPPESIQTATEIDLLHEMLTTMGPSSVAMANEDDGNNDDNGEEED